MVGVLKLAANVMAPGGHGHMLCSALQLRQLVTSLGHHTEKIVFDDSPVGNECCAFRLATLFRVHSTPLLMIYIPPSMRSFFSVAFL